MTKREKLLGTVLLSCVVIAFILFGSALYINRIRDLDSRILRTERRISDAHLAMYHQNSITRQRNPQLIANMDEETFLLLFLTTTKKVGWATKSTLQHGRRNNASHYTIILEGPSDGWIDLLDAISKMDIIVSLEGISARALENNKMRAELEIAYEIH